MSGQRDARPNIYVPALQYGGAGARLLGMARARMIRVDVSDAIVNETVHVLRDPDDNRVLECAQTAESDLVVREDKDLLRLVKFGGVPIVRAAEFLERLIERPGGEERKEQGDQ